MKKIKKIQQVLQANASWNAEEKRWILKEEDISRLLKATDWYTDTYISYWSPEERNYISKIMATGFLEETLDTLRKKAQKQADRLLFDLWQYNV